MELTGVARGVRRRLAATARVACALGVVGACEVPDPKDDTGGLGGSGGGAADPCDRGISVLSSRYESTNVAFVDWEGNVISPRVISSASTDAGLSAPLSGDVVATTVSTAGRDMVLVDRYPASVLTWVDLGTGKARAQLSVRTGFDANAQDYVEVSPELGFVSRAKRNPDPGREPFDQGSDLLVVDPRAPSILGRVALDEALAGDAPDLVPTPSRLVLAGGRVVALLGVLSDDFTTSGDARLVVIDPDARAIVETIRVEGMKNCQALAPSPAGDRLAVGCTGLIQLDGTTDIDAAGVAIVTLGEDGAPSTVSSRFPATGFGRSPQFSIAFAAEEVVLFTTFGTDPAEGGPAHGDDLVALDLARGASTVIRTSAKAFELGEVRCASACGACFVADAGASAVRRFATSAGALAEGALVRIDDGIGLPPRYLGAL